MSVVGDRLSMVLNEFGIQQKRVAILSGMAPSVITHWKGRDKLPSADSVMALADTMQLSLDWLFGRTDDPCWSPALMRAREKVWVRIRDDETLSEGDRASRLVSVWNVLKEHLPAFSEEVWALYLGWTPADWQACKSGEQVPKWSQLEAAAAITGIPERWFGDGDRRPMEELTDKVFRRALRVLRAHNLDAEDVVRMVRERENPRI